ncbi:MAG: DUF3046 domain-containing protein [Pseudonocardiales bacterium]|nr:DUF3046 domain-containing protein [Pseudonocardiales bacterium]MBV9728632.1 DUF3046 domain-containing protein [Pseudonocardiales bacterium]
MRITHLRQRMDEEFGPVRAAALAHDHVFAEFGGRTVNGALEAGIDTKRVWAVVCATFDVPEERR